jgi:hypothetical protein
MKVLNHHCVHRIDRLIQAILQPVIPQGFTKVELR